MSEADAPGALPVIRLCPEGQLPARANAGDAGLDLVSSERHAIAPGERAAVGTGIALAVPPGHAGLVLPRSGLARDHGVTLANAPGLIDAGYRGEITVLLVNLGDRPHAIEIGDRIAQLVITPVSMIGAELVTALPPSDGRGTGGFGSSGR